MKEIKQTSQENQRTIYEFSWNDFEIAVKQVSKEIIEKQNIKDIGIVGIARGGLPFITSVSHLLGIREVSIFQTQMTNSDNKYDYGEVRFVGGYLYPKCKKYILFEDIIYKGKTTGYVATYLKEKGYQVEDIYSLVIDENFNKNEYLADYNVHGVYSVKADEWVHFPWEFSLD